MNPLLRRALRSPGIQVLLVVLAALLTHAASLGHDFVYDDVMLVLENPWIRSVQGLGEAWRQSLFAFHPDAGEHDPGSSYYRPLVHVGLGLLRAVFGTSPAGYHAVLLALHALTSALVFQLLRALTRGSRQRAPLAVVAACLAGALLFAVHPVHTEAVVWVSGCMDVGATLAVLLGVLLLLRPVPSTARVLLAAGAWLAGLLVKETALVMPLLLWVTRRACAGTEEPAERTPRARYALLSLGLLAYLGLRANALGWALPGVGAASAGLRWTETFALLAELGLKLIWPVDLRVVPSAPAGAPSPFAPQVLAGVVLVLAAAALLAFSFRRAPRLFAGLSWLVLPLLPVAFVQLRGMDAYAERYLYLPSIGMALLTTLGLERLFAGAPRRARLASAVTAALLVLAAGATWVRVPVWRSELSLWQDALAHFPDNPWGHARLGTLYLRGGRPAEAAEHLERAATGLPHNAKVRGDLGIAYAMIGRTDEAVAELRVARRLAPHSATYAHNLGLALRRSGHRDQAVLAFRDALQRAPERADSHLELGRTLLQLGQPGDAIPALEAALALEPDLAPAQRALAAARRALRAPPTAPGR